jgi:hypothetical protein
VVEESEPPEKKVECCLCHRHTASRYEILMGQCRHAPNNDGTGTMTFDPSQPRQGAVMRACHVG